MFSCLYISYLLKVFLFFRLSDIHSIYSSSFFLIFPLVSFIYLHELHASSGILEIHNNNFLSLNHIFSRIDSVNRSSLESGFELSVCVFMSAGQGTYVGCVCVLWCVWCFHYVAYELFG